MTGSLLPRPDNPDITAALLVVLDRAMGRGDIAVVLDTVAVLHRTAGTTYATALLEHLLRTAPPNPHDPPF